MSDPDLAAPDIVFLADRSADDVALALDPTHVWVAWTSARLDTETVHCARCARADPARIEPIRALRFEGDAFRPSCALAGDDLLVACSVLDARATRQPGLAVARIDRASGEVRETWHHSLLGAAIFDASLAASHDTRAWAWLAFDVRAQGARSRVELGRLGPEGQWVPEPLPSPASPSQTWRRTPALAAGEHGVWAVWVEGQGRGGAGGIAVASTHHGLARAPLVLQARPEAHHEAPSVVALPDGSAVVACHTTPSPETPLRTLAAWHVALDLEVTALALPVVLPARREEAGADQGWEFATLACTDAGEVVLAGRSAHGFHACLAVGGADAPGARAALSEPGWGGRGRRSALASDGADVLFGRREPRGVVVSRLPPATLSASAPAPVTDRVPPAPPPCVVSEPVPEGLRGILFGDIHQHSVHSDATGGAEELLRDAREVYGHDFAALTDHESFCRRAIGPATWAYLCATVDAFDEPGRFVTLPGYEFTGARAPGPGHKCVYFPGTVPEVLPEKRIAALHEVLRRHDAFAIPHHLGFTGSDLEHHDPALQPCFEIASVHGVYEADGAPTAFPPRDDVYLPGESIRDALEAGHAFGLTGGSDAHGLLWHHGIAARMDPRRCGLTAVYGAPHTRAGILEALRERRVYATTGARIWLAVSRRGERRLEVHAYTGASPLAQLVLVSAAGERVLASESGPQVRVGVELSAERGWWYLRLERVDGESAFWITPQPAWR